MIKVSVLYPNGANATFDMAYYLNKHMPMVKRKLEPALKSFSVDEGLAGGQPGVAAAYVAMCHLMFDSVEAFQSAFGTHSPEILADIPNYTNTQPTVQISQVKT
jgi:uncharacterized protein (TIGR02118 family)